MISEKSNPIQILGRYRGVKPGVSNLLTPAFDPRINSLQLEKYFREKEAKSAVKSRPDFRKESMEIPVKEKYQK
ncbi:hypothetical protein OAU93_00825 [bacterium]|nr:hypothetical protein [bacterium]